MFFEHTSYVREMEGGAGDQGVTAGPNFGLGRRTWVDLIAD